jgi:IclR family transcriptional regulator, pca regulon regulatory protein
MVAMQATSAQGSCKLMAIPSVPPYLSMRLCANIGSVVRYAHKFADRCHGLQAATDGEPGNMEPADRIEGLSKGLAVLESFDTERQRLNATLAAQRAGTSRAAARRHLLTLAERGYLETDGSYFWLSPKVLRFAGSYLSSARLPRVLQPTLSRVAAQTGGAFSTVVLDADEVVIVANSGQGFNLAPAAPTRLHAYGLHLGARLPAHATSTGRVLLAARSKAEVNAWLKGRELPRLTPYTLHTAAAFRGELERVRQQDYCLAIEEHELGVHALAVPLRDLQGRTVAALNVVLPGGCDSPARTCDQWLPVLQQAARELRPLL